MRRASYAELGLSAPLIKNAQIIKSLVAVGELLESILRLRISIGRIAGELIGNCQSQKAQRELMSGLDYQHVLTN